MSDINIGKISELDSKITQLELKLAEMAKTIHVERIRIQSVSSTVSSIGVNPINITDTTNASTNPNAGNLTGSLKTFGGISVVKNLFVGATIKSYGGTAVDFTQDPTSIQKGDLTASGGLCIGKGAYIGGITRIYNTTDINGTNPSITGNLSGALQSRGGLGVSKAINAGGNIKTFSDTDSTTTISGALQSAGGLGVALNANVGGYGKFGDKVIGKNSMELSLVGSLGDYKFIQQYIHSGIVSTVSLGVLSGINGLIPSVIIAITNFSSNTSSMTINYDITNGVVTNSYILPHNTTCVFYLVSSNLTLANDIHYIRIK